MRHFRWFGSLGLATAVLFTSSSVLAQTFIDPTASLLYPASCLVKLAEVERECQVLATTQGAVSANIHFDYTYDLDTGESTGITFAIPFEGQALNLGAMNTEVIGIVSVSEEEQIVWTNGSGNCLGTPKMIRCYYEFIDSTRVEALARF
ncbi:MAG: hypothetical protein AB4040_01095 [Synechococcus sp.]